MGRSKAPTFDDFWRAYPLHKGKRDAEKAWNRLSAGDKQKALAGIHRYREYIEQTGVSIKYPQGWLNGHRWEDEYDEPAAVSAGSPGVKAAEQKGNTAAATVPCASLQGVSTSLSDMDTW